MKQKVLIVDDERLLRWSMRRKFEEWGYEVSEARDAAEALVRHREDQPALVLLDVRLPDGNGVDVLRQIRQDQSTSQVILITADPAIEDVKSAIRLGAYDYLCKPVNFEELRITVGNALETNRLREEVSTLRKQVKQSFGEHEVVGRSPRMVELMEFVGKVAASEASAILLQGESGTGKDLIARTLHVGSSRQGGPYITVNCSAIPENLLEAELFGHERGAFTDAKAMKKGLFEVANGGTLFLDEIGELPLMLQAKLLRVLEDQSFRRVGGVKDIVVDVRVVAASNRNLEQSVKAGEFRQDLFYRLSVIPIFIPPLRHRKEDIPVLASFFVERYNQKFRKNIQGLTAEADEMMMRYDWPGNVRELKNAIQRAMILEDTARIRPTYLPLGGGHDYSVLGSSLAFPETADAGGEPNWQRLPNGRSLPVFEIPPNGICMEEMERFLVEQALRQTHGNQTQAARLLDISRDALRYKMKKFELDGVEGQ